MNIILIAASEVTEQTVTLTDHRAQHIRKILGSRPGDILRAGIIGGRQGSAVVQAISNQEVTLRLDCQQQSPAKTAADLILALPRPIMLKRVLAQAAALGVARVMLINANRVEKSFFNSSQLQPARIREALLQGLEQAGDTVLPQVSLHPRFRPFIEDEFPALTPGYHLRLLAHPGPTPHHNSASTNEPASGEMVLAIGPEGGWVDFELERLQQAGFTPFSLGPRILRVDCAVPALLARTL